MERQARFVLMGSLVILFAAAICAAVYWLHGIGTFGGTSTYKIRFQGTASGITVGGSVLFNGVRVGEGIGSCNSREDRYAWRWLDARIFSARE